MQRNSVCERRVLSCFWRLGWFFCISGLRSLALAAAACDTSRRLWSRKVTSAARAHFGILGQGLMVIVSCDSVGIPVGNSACCAARVTLICRLVFGRSGSSQLYDGSR